MHPQAELIGEVVVVAFDFEIIDGFGGLLQVVRDHLGREAAVDVGDEVAGGEGAGQRLAEPHSSRSAQF